MVDFVDQFSSVNFIGQFCRSILSVSFVGHFHRSILSVNFVGQFCQSILSVDCPFLTSFGSKSVKYSKFQMMTEI